MSLLLSLYLHTWASYYSCMSSEIYYFHGNGNTNQDNCVTCIYHTTRCIMCSSHYESLIFVAYNSILSIYSISRIQRTWSQITGRRFKDGYVRLREKVFNGQHHFSSFTTCRSYICCISFYRFSELPKRMINKRWVSRSIGYIL